MAYDNICAAETIFCFPLENGNAGVRMFIYVEGGFNLLPKLPVLNLRARLYLPPRNVSQCKPVNLSRHAHCTDAVG